MKVIINAAHARAPVGIDGSADHELSCGLARVIRPRHAVSRTPVPRWKCWTNP